MHVKRPGKTPDKKDLRIIVSFEGNNLLIVTAIDLDAEDKK